MFSHINIKNFRSCYDTDLELGPSVCALTGRNGTGKSNILKAIEWACSSATSSTTVDSSSAGNFGWDQSEVSVTLQIIVENTKYVYSISVPERAWIPAQAGSPVMVGISEVLQVVNEDGSKMDLIIRSGEEIRILGRSEPIRVAASTPAIGAMLALLPADAEILRHIRPISDFFGGVRYYSLDDRPNAKVTVTGREYDDWRLKYQTEGALTHSVALRLIYMWKEDDDLLKEFNSIVGPDGIGLIDRLEIISIGRSDLPFGPGDKENSAQTKFYILQFWPSKQMGGAGEPFSFADLSAGTRRVIRLVTSMLFDKRSLMLLEEPEDSIHTGLLRKLIDIFRAYSDKVQMIFTTHSLDVLDILRPEEVLMITAPDGRTHARKLTSIEIARAKKFLENDGSLSEFLEPITEQ